MPTPLGERVREQRRKRGLTLEGLAERVGSSKSYMWEIENKEVVRPSAEKLAMIATARATATCSSGVISSAIGKSSMGFLQFGPRLTQSGCGD